MRSLTNTFTALTFGAGFALAACSSGSGAPGAGGAQGLAGSTAMAGTGGGGSLGGSSNGNGGMNAAGNPPTAGGGLNGNGGTAGAGLAGTAGTAGSSAGAGNGGTAGMAGASGAAGMAGAGGAGFWGPGGPQKQWSCPEEPLGEQMLSGSMDVCEDFEFSGNWNEGTTWIASQGAFFFSTFPIGSYEGGDIIKYTPGGDCEIWLENVGCNGLGVSPSGNLLAACQGPRAVLEYNVVTKEARVIADMVDGEMLDSPNDLVARSDGNIYFSNRTAELGNRPQGLGEGLVRIDPEGNLSVIQMGGLNGVALSPDETKLHVVGMGTWTLAADGTPMDRGEPTPGGDGIAVDCLGNITNDGTNSAYGGADGKTLLIVGGTDARVVTATVPGLP